MALYNCLQRSALCDMQFLCTECKRKRVDTNRIASGMVFIQSGFVYTNSGMDGSQNTIVFALCRKCCDKHTLTKLRWKWAEWQWKWSQFVWFLKQLCRRVNLLK
jgi:hypothetical protein